MSRIFTIGTRKRCTRVLEEQAQRAVDNAKSQPVIILEQAIGFIEDEDYASAIYDINSVKSNLQTAINRLDDAATDINDGYYEQAIEQIRMAISYIR